jgi:hypothetical protein
MGTLERRETLTHPLGAGGSLSVKAITGVLRVRGIEGDAVHVTVTYRIRATDQASAERALESGRVTFDRGPGFLGIETPERRLSTGLAWLFGGARVNADIAVDVPWGAKVRVETMSGSIEAANLVGDQKYRTVSGDIRLWSLGGLVEAGTISGGVTLDGGSELRLRANTISGGIKARARLFRSLNLSTTSGSMTVIAALDPAGEHRTESISGTIDFTPISGVSAELKTVSGSIHSEIEHRVEGSRGFWKAIVGDGSARLRVNSTSGSLRLMAPRPGTAAAAASRPAAGPDPVAGADGSATAGEPVDSNSTGRASVSPAAAGAAEAGSNGPSEPSGSSEPTPGPETSGVEESAESWNPDESVDDELAVLIALERGEIGVDEAAARLEKAGGNGDVG